ncbi:hypothetical protein H4R33_002496 [Dimargaris cristalligena]|uniref:Uncharacterized protein n=1 Tax=Dimargaris cristalligena TaxID=215637 RepID=A0A4P9ZJW8_9FUNG|nr:hypothetical protein H4R33_002496 [Dimargaris cristalligena]RKP33328.1 hypothetical protein BJ085DRAFT_39691 [Dimargaris cristalligena]|eukprot:RKP33328.1 hypothetical protein BJ085DRAFT_39691 [Dimargaris cristalligena]
MVVVSEQPRRCSDETLTDNQRLDIRAQQRTLDGSIWRTAVGCLTAGLVIFKVFSNDLYKLGLVFLVYSLVISMAGIVRKYRSPTKFYELDYYRTGGNYVAFISASGLIAWSTILYMVASV